jgi:hypothetical protein
MRAVRVAIALSLLIFPAPQTGAITAPIAW